MSSLPSRVVIIAECCPPAAIVLIFPEIVIFSGTGTISFVLEASCLRSFAPHAYNELSNASARTWFAPNEISVIFSRGLLLFVITLTGWFLNPFTLIPSWPLSLLPHVTTIPFDFNAELNSFPAEILIIFDKYMSLLALRPPKTFVAFVLYLARDVVESYPLLPTPSWPLPLLPNE